MRVAALYDIHGNLPALEAVLEDARKAGVTHVVVGGDVVPGPMPREALACLLRLQIPVEFIRGNGETELLAELAGAEPNVPPQSRGILTWTAAHLQPGEVQFLRTWPSTIRLDVPGVGAVLFCHATPRNDTEIFTRLTPEEVLRPVFAGTNTAVVVCGHTHIQFDRVVGATRVVNAGSVGMPFGDPGAFWLLLGPDVELRKTVYDLQGAADRIRRTPYPAADEFVTKYLLNPPSEADMLQAFSRAALK